MKKILILGSSGAGKSTLAKTLGELFEIEVLHLDRIYWEENWVIRDKLIYLKDLSRVLEKHQYIIDGNHNYGNTLELRVQVADTILFLNLNRFICLYGAIKRYFMYKNKTRSSMTAGCEEKIDFEFIKYILWDYPRKKKKLILSLVNEEFKGEFYQFKTHKDIDKFLEKLGVKI